MSTPIAVFFMGLSGSGKDTQAGFLKEFLEKRDGEGSVLYIYTGDILRDLAKKDTSMGRWIQTSVMEAGKTAPASVAIWAWQQFLNENFQGGEHLIFSSSPRTSIEAWALDDFMKGFGISAVFPLFINVRRTEAFRRLKARGRRDDTDETINSRLNYFEDVVRPAVEYFRKESNNQLVEIDGNSQDPQKIHQDILQVLGLTTI